MNPFVAICLWLYRRLARAFPHEFQIVYGADVIQLGEDVIQEIWLKHGFTGLLRLIADLALRVPLEYLAEIRRDLVYSVRTLIKSPGFAIVGIASLGLGIGVTTTAFSEINALMLRDNPAAKDPKRLVITQQPASYPYFENYRDHRELFSTAAAYIQNVPFAVATDDSTNAKTERVFGHIVSPEYLSVIGVDPARGRNFDPSIDKPGSAPVVIVSDRFWRNRLDSDPRAIGRVLRLNGQPTTIIGIAPKTFLGVFPLMPGDLFVPTTVSSKLAPELADDAIHNRDAKAFGILLRLAPGVSLKSAESALDTITQHLDEGSPNIDRNAKGRRVRLIPGGGIIPLPPEVLPVLLGFWAILMGLILTIACMNLANMLLARAAARRKEIAVRLAVGASRFRLIRQFLVESVLLSIAGGIAGMVFAYWLTNAASQMKLPMSFPFEFDIRPDSSVLLFTFLLSVIVGIGFGLAPAFETTRTDVATSLKDGGETQLRAYRRFGLRNLLVIYQVAGSLALLLITGFLVIGFSKTGSADVPLDPHTMYLLAIDPIRDGYSPDQAAALFEKLPDRIRQSAAIQQIALAEVPPFTTPIGAQNFSSNELNGGNTTILRGASIQSIGASYFDSISVRLLAGREFDQRDQRVDATKSLPVIVNLSAATGLFGSADPIGRRIVNAGQNYDVVGVVPDLKTGFFTGGGTAPLLYTPLTTKSFAHPPPGGMTVMIRSTAGRDALDSVRRQIASIDPNLSIFNIRTLQESLDQNNAQIRIGMVIYGGIGVFGLILASVGLAGVTAYSVARRRKEIGIRMALGAGQGQVLRLVLKEGSMLVLIGSLLGFAAAFGISKALSSLTHIWVEAFKVGTNDPRLIFGAPALLAALAMLACYLPARRSTKIDPLRALREE